MTPMDIDQIIALAAAHKWAAAAALVIGFVVRLTKTDTKVPIDVPAKWRAPLALVLGQVSGVLEHVAASTAWKAALLGGLASTVVAILGHEWIVERFLKPFLGKFGGDLPVPMLMKPAETPPVSNLKEPIAIVSPEEAGNVLDEAAKKGGQP